MYAARKTHSAPTWRSSDTFQTASNGARNARSVLLRKRIGDTRAAERILERHAVEGESRSKRRDVREWVECARLDRRVEMAKAAAEAGPAVLRQPVSKADSRGDVPEVGV